MKGGLNMAKLTENKDPKQVISEIEGLVKGIKSFDGSSSPLAEEACRKDIQYLLCILSEIPLMMHEFSDELKVQIKEIMNWYLEWSFGGYW